RTGDDEVSRTDFLGPKHPVNGKRRNLKVDVQDINEAEATATLEISWGQHSLSITETIAHVAKGVMVDAGGWVLVNGKLKKIPPWGPINRILQQLMIFQSEDLSQLSPTAQTVVRREALEEISADVDLLREETEPFHTPPPLARKSSLMSKT